MSGPELAITILLLSFSTSSITRWLREKILLFVLLIDMLLIFDHDNYVMEWTVTKVVQQYPDTVSASGLLSCFAVHSPRLQNIIDRICVDSTSSTLHDWGCGKDTNERVLYNPTSSERSLDERLKS